MLEVNFPFPDKIFQQEHDRELSCGLQMERYDIPSSHFNKATPLFTASGQRLQFRQTGRESKGICACSFGCVILLFGLMLIAMGPSVISSAFPLFDVLMLIVGVVLFVPGAIVLTGTIREKRRITLAVQGRDGISLDVISSETGVPFDRAKEYLANMIAAGLIKGGIFDNTYVASMQAEIIDARTIRCPHCDAEIELPEDF